MTKQKLVKELASIKTQIVCLSTNIGENHPASRLARVIQSLEGTEFSPIGNLQRDSEVLNKLMTVIENTAQGPEALMFSALRDYWDEDRAAGTVIEKIALDEYSHKWIEDIEHADFDPLQALISRAALMMLEDVFPDEKKDAETKER